MREIEDLKAWTREISTFVLQGNIQHTHNATVRNALVVKFNDSGVLDFVARFIHCHQDLVATSSRSVVSVDSDSNYRAGCVAPELRDDVHLSRKIEDWGYETFEDETEYGPDPSQNSVSSQQLIRSESTQSNLKYSKIIEKIKKRNNRPN